MPIKTGSWDTFRNKYIDESNSIKWPSDEKEKVDVGQTLLGISFVADSDYWFEFARDVVINPRPPKPYVRPWNDAAKKDRAYREVLSTLNDDQKRVVLRLLRNVIDGTIFSALVNLRQFPYSNVVVQLVNRNDQASYTVQVVPGDRGGGIHERWHEWVEDFSARNDSAEEPTVE